MKIAAQRNDVGTIHAIITHFMNNTEIIFGKLRVDFVKFTFFEVFFNLFFNLFRLLLLLLNILVNMIMFYLLLL